MRQEQRRLQQASHRHEKYRKQRQQKIEDLHQQLEANQSAKDNIARTVSRLDELSDKQMVRMDSRSKTLMDTLRIIARNLFYRSLESFKQAYNNYRDDHDHWRELTRSTGVLHATARTVEVHLIPRVNYAPKLETLMRHQMEQWNTQHSELTDGSGRRIEIHLAKRDQIEINLRRPSQ